MDPHPECHGDYVFCVDPHPECHGDYVLCVDPHPECHGDYVLCVDPHPECHGDYGAKASSGGHSPAQQSAVRRLPRNSVHGQ